MKKKHKLLMVAPSGNEVKLGYLSPSSDGFVLGASKIEGVETSHLTVMSKEGILSSHITPQDNIEEKRKHLHTFNIKDLPKDLLERAMENLVKPVPPNKLLEDVLYFTQKFFDWVDSVQRSLYEERTTRKEVIHVINVKKLVENLPQLIEELNQSPSSFFGVCKIREILDDSSKIVGVTNSRMLVLPVENQLYYFDFSLFLNFNPTLEQQQVSNPLSEVFRSIGINQYMHEVGEKQILTKLLSKALQNTETLREEN